MNELTKEMPIIKKVYTFVLAGCWTDTERINRVKMINDIPKSTNHTSVYNPETNTTTIKISSVP